MQRDNNKYYLNTLVIIGMLVGWGVVYGTLYDKVQANEQKIRELEPVASQLSAIIQSNQDIKQNIEEIKSDIRQLRQRDSVLPRQGR